MPISKYKKEKIKEIQKKALALYKQGLSTREIAPLFNVSHTYIWELLRAVDKSLSQVQKDT